MDQEISNVLLEDTTEQQESDELQSAIATYMPDRQIITFSAAMQVAPRESSGPAHFTGTHTGYFFHEWIHYLHNVSTGHGITAFANLVVLWSAFRSTTDNHGFGQGESPSAPVEEFMVKQRLELLVTTRGSRGGKLPPWATPDRCKVVSHAPASREGYGRDHISMTVEVSNAEGAVTTLSTSLGAHEILESVAYLLEKRLVNALGGEPSPVPVVPYHALVLLAKHVAPALTEEEVLICGLGSLQYTFPADAIGHLFSECNAATAGAQVRPRMHKLVVDNLNEHQTEIQRCLDDMEATFPSDAGFGKAAREVVSTMRRNINARLVRPFFELDLIDQVKASGIQGFHVLMDEFMKAHGVCSCKQERPGFLDDLGRDDLFEFAIAARDDDLNQARRIMQASFEFLARHFSTDGTLRSTQAARLGPCLFYTSCREPMRHERGDDCRNQPWLAAIAEGHKCWYAQGVLQLRPDHPAPSTCSTTA
ncbi:hypothetical protein [Burkholderia gladioli]|uniref:hypothetical protein n=1 Tax=Burkholderia gladioli TaxID=28095 RepID=UPI00163EA682|nr:hypothetical protein [Burkholderia gladioli]